MEHLPRIHRLWDAQRSNRLQMNGRICRDIVLDHVNRLHGMSSLELASEATSVEVTTSCPAASAARVDHEGEMQHRGVSEDCRQGGGGSHATCELNWL